MSIKRFTGVYFDDNLSSSVMLAVGRTNGKLVSCFIEGGKVQYIRILGEPSAAYLETIQKEMPKTNKASYIWKFITKLYISLEARGLFDGASHEKSRGTSHDDKVREVKL